MHVFCDLFYVHVYLISSVSYIIRYKINKIKFSSECIIDRLYYIKLEIMEGNHISVYFEIYVKRNLVSKNYIRLQTIKLYFILNIIKYNIKCIILLNIIKYIKYIFYIKLYLHNFYTCNNSSISS